MKLESTTVGELQVGDIVHAHGMILEIDHAPVLSQSHAGGRTYWTAALVLNRDDVSDDSIPFGWTERTPEGDRRRGLRPEYRVTRPEHRWTLQGNDLHRVAREPRWKESAHPDLRALNALGMHRDLGGCPDCRR